MYDLKLYFVFLFGACCLHGGWNDPLDKPAKLLNVRFLVTVNDTWADPPGCITTIVSPKVSPHVSETVTVGECDHGPIEYSVSSPGKENNTYTVSLIFHSSVIVDASPPTCDISWNGTYLVPKPEANGEPDLLPSCFTADSREGYHMTYYWFHLLDWEFET